jgi:hypothetical protein
MQQSTSFGAEQAAASSPLSTSDSTSSAPSKPTFSPPLKDKQRKLALADQARLMQDNARILQMTTDCDRAYRDQLRRAREAQLSTMGVQPVASDPAKADDMGDINIDSPTVHTHSPGATAGGAAAPASALGSLAAKVLPLAAAALLGGGVGAGALALLKPAAQAVTQGAATTINTTKGFNLELVP